MKNEEYSNTLDKKYVKNVKKKCLANIANYKDYLSNDDGKE